MKEKENNNSPNYKTEAKSECKNDASNNNDKADDSKSKEWDEGGPSHCSYPQTPHDTLMAVGKQMSGSFQPQMGLVNNLIQNGLTVAPYHTGACIYRFGYQIHK
eukprot:14025821-Ditylum_brightwellii.AAC.1